MLCLKSVPMEGYIIHCMVVVVLLNSALCDMYSPYSELNQDVNIRKARDLRQLKDRFSYNEMLLDNIHQPYEIVLPQQVERGRTFSINTHRHKIRHHGTHEHLEHLTIQLVIEGKEYKIKLIRNEVLLSSGITVKHFENDNQQVLTKTVEHCYYHGYVKKEDWSSVAISTCKGIRGVIEFQNKTFIIQPLIEDDTKKEHRHVIFQSSVSPEEKCGNSHGLWMPFQELHKRELIKQMKFLNAQKKYNSQPEDKSNKLLRIALVLDKSMYMGLEFSQQHVIQYAVDVANIVDSTLESACRLMPAPDYSQPKLYSFTPELSEAIRVNFLAKYFRQLNFEIALTYLEFWNLFDRFEVDSSHRSVLNKFLHFQKTEMPDAVEYGYDATFFITGTEFDNHQVGIAIPDSICSDRPIAVVKAGRPFEPQQTATILSHMAGHILGIEHDEDGGCFCGDDFGCIMSSDMLSVGSFHSRMFSTCSKSDLGISLNMGITSCLWGAPEVNTEFKQTCGNNIVERGEECDCGSPEECKSKDPCCDPSTCLLKHWAQCRSGPCCNNCTFLSSTHMCRPRQTECDIPEFCSGQSGDCPFNTYIEDGHPCRNKEGYCLGGICPSVDEQCQGIWGTGATSGHEQCFQRFNPTGNFNGHCGKNKVTGSFAKCQHSDISCGLLHCEGGKDSPLYGSDKGFSTTKINANNIEYECKSVQGPAMMDMPHMGMVQDGTKCGQNKICMRNACVPMAVVPKLDCPSADLALLCSGHGVCAPDDSCFCDDGWEGHDCNEKSNITVVAAAGVASGDGMGSRMAGAAGGKSGMSTTVGSVGADGVVNGDAENAEKVYILEDEKEKPLTAPVEEGGSGISTTLLIVILSSVVGVLILAMAVTLICYRRRTPSKNLFNTKSNKTYDKAKSNPSNKRVWGLKRKKFLSSEEESESGDLPPPPIIVMDPDSAMPEKGILKKNSTSRLAALDNQSLKDTGSSGSNGSNMDQDSVGPYMYEEDEDAEAEEIRNIFRDKSEENLDNLQDSASFDFVIPPPPQPPPPQCHLPDYYPSPSMRRGHYEVIRFPHDYENPTYCQYREPVDVLPQQAMPMWRTALPPQTLSPPQSRIVKLRNHNDYMHKATIDLSPSPDEMPSHQLSPSTTCTSEDVRSSGTEPDRCQQVSNSDLSPTSINSTSTQHTKGPSFGNLSQYLLKRAEATTNSPDLKGNEDYVSFRANEQYQSQSHQQMPHHKDPHVYDPYVQHNPSVGFLPKISRSTLLHHDDSSYISMPPPMNPINIRNILSSKGGNPPASSTSGRENSNTPQGSINGDSCSFSTGTGNSKHGFDKSSGYGSEQDHERFSLEDTSRSDSHSRSESLSRSLSASPPSYSAVIRTGPNRIQLVPSGHSALEEGREIEGIQKELNKLLENLPRIHQGSYERSPLQSTTTPSTPLTGQFAGIRPLKDESLDGGAPCIDRSLEEIPAYFTDKRKKTNKAGGGSTKGKRQISSAIQNNKSSSSNGNSNGNSNSSLDEVQSLMEEEMAA